MPSPPRSHPWSPAESCYIHLISFISLFCMTLYHFHVGIEVAWSLLEISFRKLKGLESKASIFTHTTVVCHTTLTLCLLHRKCLISTELTNIYMSKYRYMHVHTCSLDMQPFMATKIWINHSINQSLKYKFTMFTRWELCVYEMACPCVFRLKRIEKLTLNKWAMTLPKYCELS